MGRCDGRLSQILQVCIFVVLWICWNWTHCSSSLSIVHLELWYLNLWTGFEFSSAPDPLSVIPIISYLPIAGAPGTGIAKQFRIFTESTMLKTLQSITQENRDQLLDSPEADPTQYISNHPEMGRLSRQYRVDVSYPKTWLVYSSDAWRIRPSISSLWNEVQAHLRSSLLLSLIVSYLTLHACSKPNFNTLPLIINIWSR